MALSDIVYQSYYDRARVLKLDDSKATTVSRFLALRDAKNQVIGASSANALSGVKAPNPSSAEDIIHRMLDRQRRYDAARRTISPLGLKIIRLCFDDGRSLAEAGFAVSNYKGDNRNSASAYARGVLEASLGTLEAHFQRAPSKT